MEKRFRIDFILVGCVITLALIGIFTLYTQELIVENPEGRWYKQLIFFGLGLLLMFGIRSINYQIIESYALPLYGISIFLLLITLIPFIGSEIKGARSWIRIGPVGFQTSEFAKLATIILLARYLELKEKEIEHLHALLIPTMIALLPMLLIIVQPDFGGSFSFAPIFMSMIFIAGADVYHLGSVIAFLGISLSIPLYIEYHRITLVDPLIEYLIRMDKNDLLPVVRILRKDIWDYADTGIIPKSVDGSDRIFLENVLNNPKLLGVVREAITAVRNESGGVILRVFENEWILIGVGLLFAIAATVMFIFRITQGNSMKHLRKFYIPFGVIGISLLAATTVHLTFSFKYHQVVRVTAFINPDKFPRDLAYQIRASKAAVGSGQFLGRGFFQGDMTMGVRPLVPEAYTDFIFTSWGERTGFVGTIFVLLLLILIPIRGMFLSFTARDKFGSLLAAGISFMFFYHIFFNIGIALGLLPVTGLPLSFLSYGGSHMTISMVGIGILLSIHRRRFAN